MKDTQHSSRKKGLNSKLLLLAGVIILIFTTTNLVKSWQKNQEINQEISALEQEIINIESDNLQLSELIKYLNSTAYIEEKARTDLGLKKEGENIIIIPNSNMIIPSDISLEEDEKDLEPSSSPKKWWRYFFAKT